MLLPWLSKSCLLLLLLLLLLDGCIACRLLTSSGSSSLIYSSNPSCCCRCCYGLHVVRCMLVPVSTAQSIRYVEEACFQLKLCLFMTPAAHAAAKPLQYT
jgi:hypothetical protein